MIWISYLFLLVLILVSVAFFTLLERRVLGLIHFRLGPNKVGPAGLFQPLGDAIKLFIKGGFLLGYGSSFVYWLMPFWGLNLMFLLWVTYGPLGGSVHAPWGFIIFFCLISLVVYYLMLGGWSGASKYGLLGSYRSSAQSVSYEIALVFLILSSLFFMESYMWVEKYSGGLVELGFWFFLILIWMLLILAESNRSPFDLTEGESELVSGFNVEYGGMLFSLIFIGEYGFMLFFSLLTVFLWAGGFSSWFTVLLVCFFYIWIRGTVPRMRYDKLMILVWLVLLPLVLCSLIVVILEISKS